MDSNSAGCAIFFLDIFGKVFLLCSCTGTICAFLKDFYPARALSARRGFSFQLKGHFMKLGLGLGLNKCFTGGAPTPFTPLAVSGLKLWLDASDTSTISTGTTFTWSDKSGYGNNAIQSTAASQPITGTRTLNGLNTLDFDGTNDKLSLPSALHNIAQGNNTVFIVAATDNATKTAQYILSGTNSSSSRYRISYLSSGGQFEVLNGTTSTPASHTVNANAHILTLMRSNTYLYGAVDGTIVPSSTTSGNSNGLDQLALGTQGNNTSNAFDGRMAEVLIFDRNLKSAEANQVMNYLSAKWGISVSTISWSDVSIVVFGDSITEGNAASTAANRWANLTASSLSGTLLNKGISGTYLQNTVLSGTGLPQTNNGRDRYVDALLGRNKQDKVFILYGTNDIRSYPAQPTLNVTDFTTDYGEILSGLIAGGYAPDDITIGTAPYCSYYDDPTEGPIQQVLYNTAVYNLAVTYGVRYADVYTYMLNNGAGTLISGDNLHPNNAGHAAISTALLAAGFMS